MTMSMRIKMVLIILIATVSFITDFAIGYFMIWLWFTILNPGIIQTTLILVSLISTGWYAGSQFTWAARKIKELKDWGQEVVDNLNRNVAKETKRGGGKP